MAAKLGELLLEEKMITPQQLEDALEYQKANGGQLGKALVALGFLRDEDIRRLLSRQYGFPSISLDRLEVDPKIIDIIPAATARKYKVLPSRCSRRPSGWPWPTPPTFWRSTTSVSLPVTGSSLQRRHQSPWTRRSTATTVLHEDRGPSRTTDRHAAATGDAGLRRLEEPPLTQADMASIGGLSEIDLDSMNDTEADVETVRSEDDEIDLATMSKSADAAPVIKLTNVLLVDSLKRGASDIHIEPYEKEFRVRFRIDGILYNVMALPMKLRDPLISRVKIMAKLDIAEKRLPQAGRIRIKMKVEDRSRDLDFRVSVRPTIWGERIALQLLDRSALKLDMSKLGFEPHSLERFRDAISKPSGIVLVTGPTRSGKTNTLYSALASLNKPDTNIMTAEDSIEFDLPAINQVYVNESIERASRASCAPCCGRTRTSSWSARSATPRRRRSRCGPRSKATCCCRPSTLTTRPAACHAWSTWGSIPSGWAPWSP